MPMLVLPASLTNRDARDTLRLLTQSLPKDGDAPVTIDASGLQQLDTSAIAVLLECRRLAQAWGKAFEIKRPPAKLIALAELYGVDELLVRQG
jgi:phospholipid transport system transporter-binding protein